VIDRLLLAIGQQQSHLMLQLLHRQYHIIVYLLPLLALTQWPCPKAGALSLYPGCGVGWLIGEDFISVLMVVG